MSGCDQNYQRFRPPQIVSCWWNGSTNVQLFRTIFPYICCSLSNLVIYMPLFLVKKWQSLWNIRSLYTCACCFCQTTQHICKHKDGFPLQFPCNFASPPHLVPWPPRCAVANASAALRRYRLGVFRSENRWILDLYPVGFMYGMEIRYAHVNRLTREIYASIDHILDARAIEQRTDNWIQLT